MLFATNHQRPMYTSPFEHQGVRLTVADICTAFDNKTMGSKFTSPQAAEAVCELIAQAEFPENGQGFINAEKLVKKGMVRSGDAPATDNPEDYKLLKYRGQVQKLLNSKYADEIILLTACNLVVYTKEAYLVDPDVHGDEEAGIPRDEDEYNRIQSIDCTHVLVAVLATGSPVKSTVSPFRFVANLAGGNKDYEDMTKEELVQLAREVRDNAQAGWVTVVDF